MKKQEDKREGGGGKGLGKHRATMEQLWGEYY